jgi:hypothetical protein
LQQALDTLYADLSVDMPKLGAEAALDLDEKEDDGPCVMNKFNPRANAT